MENFNGDKLILEHKRSFGNGEDIIKGGVCGCFYCRKIFDASEITDYITERDGLKTARCPYCGIDSVIKERPDRPVTPEFLDEMHRRWF